MCAARRTINDRICDSLACGHAVELNRADAMPNQTAVTNIRTDAYKHLAKIVAVLKNQLHVVPDGSDNLDIWHEVLRVKPL